MELSAAAIVRLGGAGVNGAGAGGAKRDRLYNQRRQQRGMAVVKRFIIPSVAILVTVVVLACSGLTEAGQRYNDGVDAQEDGRLEEAVTLYTEAIELDPELAQAYVSRSAAYGDLGRFEEALDDATKAIELEPSDVNLLAGAYVNRAFDLAGLGRFEEAEADLGTACELGLMEACELGP